MVESDASLLTILRHSAAEIPDRPFVSIGERSWSRDQFLRRVAAAFTDIRGLSGPIGLLVDDRVTWMAALIALEAVGQTIVPIPAFFSDQQIAHVLKDAGVRAIVVDGPAVTRAEALAYPFRILRTDSCDPSELPAATRPGARQITYTSGSTGAPKGVLLASAALNRKAATVISASGSTADDRVLSVLPLSLLLEQIVAVRAPILAGASVFAAADSATPDRQMGTFALADLVERVRPSVLVLVPELLKAWVVELRATHRRAPLGLRFVAVGGAAVPKSLADKAWARGIPVHEGYGLSECGSVVALNRPGERRGGTVGRPLPDCDVAIENGEIVVRGAAVMERYCHGPSTHGVLHTGDLGTLSADGVLTVHGRRDNLIVLSNGRNVSPEWIEGTLLADSAIARCLVIGTGEDSVSAIVERSTGADPTALSTDRLDALLADLPIYAQPGRMVVVGPGTFAQSGLLSPNGRVRRDRHDAASRLVSVASPPAPLRDSHP